MEKTIIELLQKKSDSYQVVITVEATMLSEKEHKDVRNELWDLKFNIVQMDSDYIKAEIQVDNYGKGMIEILENKGWKF